MPTALNVEALACIVHDIINDLFAENLSTFLTNSDFLRVTCK